MEKGEKMSYSDFFDFFEDYKIESDKEMRVEIGKDIDENKKKVITLEDFIKFCKDEQIEFPMKEVQKKS